jgi:hypothetical protein
LVFIFTAETRSAQRAYFVFLLSAERPESKNQQTFGAKLATVSELPAQVVRLCAKAESFSFAVLSTAKEKDYFFSLRSLRLERSGRLIQLNYPHSRAWT